MLFTYMTGAEPWSHVGDRAAGVLCIHGFGGSAYQMGGVGRAFAAEGYHVEVPVLAGHGTTVDDVITTGWADWTASAEEAYRRLAARVETVVVVGLSMGGAVTLWLAAEHPETAGIVCINPLVEPPDGMVATLRAMLDAGELFLPERPNDIAEPGVEDVRYARSAVPSLISLFEDGIVPMLARHSRSQVPLLLMTAPQDNSVPASQSDVLANVYGGPVERITLERSFHVATLDYDRTLIEDGAVAFAARVIDAAAE